MTPSERRKAMNGVSWRDYVDSRITALEKATALASATLEKRLEGMNEFREALRNQASLFVTRNEMEIQMTKMADDIRILRESKAMLEGKASNLYVTVTLVITIIGLIIGVINLFSRFQ